MVWNIFMHILIGLLGANQFTLTTRGLIICLVVVAFTQCADIVNFIMVEKRKIMKGPQNGREEKLCAFKNSLPKILPPMFLKNWMIYTTVVIFFAEVGRNYDF